MVGPEVGRGREVLVSDIVRLIAPSMEAKNVRKTASRATKKQLAANKLHNVRVSTNGERSRTPVGVRLCRCEARATLPTLTSVNQSLTPTFAFSLPISPCAPFLDTHLSLRSPCALYEDDWGRVSKMPVGFRYGRDRSRGVGIVQES